MKWPLIYAFGIGTAYVVFAGSYSYGRYRAIEDASAFYCQTIENRLLYVQCLSNFKKAVQDHREDH